MARVGDGLDFSSASGLRAAIALVSALIALLWVIVQQQPLGADLFEGATGTLILDYLLRNAARYGRRRPRSADRG